MKKSKYYKENKRILKERKNKCEICGETAECCLEFHHIGPKLFNISQGIRWVTTKQLLQELKYTICVCKNCHSKLHKGLIKYDRDISGL